MADTGPSCGLSQPSLKASRTPKGSGRGRALLQLVEGDRREHDIVIGVRTWDAWHQTSMS